MDVSHFDGFAVVSTDTAGATRDHPAILAPRRGASRIGLERVFLYQPIFAKELKVIGSRTYFMSDFPLAIRLLAGKKIKVKPIISEILPLERFTEGLEHLEKEPERYVKVLVHPTPPAASF